MATLTGGAAADTLTGTRAGDLILGFDPATGLTAGATVTPVSQGLGQAVFATAAPGDQDHLFVLDKAGIIRIVDLATGTLANGPFLDISALVADTGEQGLLGLAFHPDYASNGRFFVYFSRNDGDTEVREFRVSAADPTRADPASGRTVLRLDQPEFSNHKGGWIGFGPADGLLYIATGDGGGGGDPNDNAQNTSSLLGKILRIDIDRDAFPGNAARNYAIPADNPFAAGPGADEVWAYGLRNPWRDSFDRGSHRLFIGDVGQGEWEEVNIGAAGANYGWRRFEGPDPFNPPGGGSTAGLTFPIHAYGRGEGDRSIIGGYVHRGPESGLHGAYVFGDFASGRVWTLQDADGDGSWTRRDLLPAATLGPFVLASFAEDAEGHLYAVLLDGRLVRLEFGAAPADAGDRLAGGAGDDRIFAGGGADQVSGDAGDDLLSGMEGDDTLLGGGGRDSLVGGGDGDSLRGGVAADSLLGGDGDDRLDGGAGPDLLRGGLGTDLALYGASTAGVTVNLATGHGAGGEAAGDRLAGIENLSGSDFADLLTGNAGRNLLVGGAGADSLRGGGGSDTLVGEAGSDRLSGQGGADLFRLRSLADSAVAAPDVILDFNRSERDRIDLGAIDADPDRAGNQAFVFIGAAAFSGDRPEVRAVVTGTTTRIELDTGDGIADAALELARALALQATDFIL